MKNENYRICAKTIMDTTSDPDITFNGNGVSNYVKLYEELIKLRVPTADKAKEILDKTIVKIKEAGKNKDYDCLIGVSGGVDSTYVAWLTKELGLRPLAVHVDNGWNSELAVSNIGKTLKNLNIELYTEVLNWEEFRDLQLSFLKASTADGEIPSDHIIMAVLMKTANKFGIKYIINGSNIRTEGILPRTWARGHLDWKYIKSVHKQFGKTRIKTIPHISIIKVIYYLYIKNIKMFPILNFVDYSNGEAMKILKEKLDWQYYGGKHYESVYTRFYQGYILPKKFNIDKRRGHLSSLICSGEISREQALVEINHNPYSDESLEKQDIEFVLKKFNLSQDEFDEIMKMLPKTIFDYPNNFKNWEHLRRIYWNFRKNKNDKSN